MPGSIGSRIVSAVSIAILLACVCFPAAAQIRFDLPAQPLAQALTALGSAANLNIYFDASTVDGKQAPALKAQLSADDALARLLTGTHLRAVRVDENTVRVVSDDETKHAQGARSPATGSTYSTPPVHLASADARSEAALANASSTDQGASGREGQRIQSAGLDEVIVSAQKREERLQDVPVPVTAIQADQLIEGNQPRLQDYYSSVPGLNLTPANQSAQFLSIRGITTGGFTNPTVGVVVDDVPFGSSTELGGAQVIPDIDPGDLARVEVLRGPQGTLYGASSMGGLLKFVTVDPSTSSLSGHVQAETSTVHNGAEPGYNFRGSINVPLSDTFAFRASAFTRQDPGYIDNPVLHLNGVNEEHVSGARLATLWKPTDVISLKVSALYQQTKGNGSNAVEIEPGLGDLQQNDLRNTGGYDRRVQAYSATLNADLGGITLTSISGYNIDRYSDSFDYTYALGAISQLVYGAPFSGQPLLNFGKTEKFTQEVRLSQSIGSSVDWLFGLYYTHESSVFKQDALAVDPITGTVAADALSADDPTSFKEYAAFGDVTYHFTDQFDIQLGARESEIKQSTAQTEAGGYVPLFFGGAASPFVLPEVHSSNNAFTYLVTPRWKMSADLMAYARLASGYRAGGPNLSPAFGTPPQYNPDKTQNYELGVKGDFLEHRLSVDASLYYIDWKNIQLQLLNAHTGFAYDINGSRAKSEGAELSIESRPLAGLTLGAWIVWNEAVLTESFPANSEAYGVSGDRLPNTSRFSGNLSAEENFPITDTLTGFVGATESYVGYRQGIFGTVAAPQRQSYAPYAKTDLRFGGRYDTWTASLSVNNVTDRRGVIGGGLGAFPPFGFYYIQPRTIALSVTKSFGR